MVTKQIKSEQQKSMFVEGQLKGHSCKSSG